MTAINAFTQGNAAYLLTDGGIFDHWTGALGAIGSKVIAIRHLGAAIGFSGVPNWNAYREWMPQYPDLASLLGQLPELAEKAQAVIVKAGRDGGELPAPVYIYIAAFDRADRKAKLYCYSSDKGPNGTLRPGLSSIAALLQPKVADGSFRVRDLVDPACFNVKRDAVTLLKAQRQVRELGTSRVGGFVELVRVSRWGIRRKVLHRWPEDRCGRTIVL